VTLTDCERARREGDRVLGYDAIVSRLEERSLVPGPTGLGTSAARLTITTPDPYMRLMVDVARSGYLQKIAALVDGYSAEMDEAAVTTEATILVDELRHFGIDCSQAFAKDLSTFRRLVLPIDDQALGLALSRTYLYPTIIDDACGENQAEAFRALGTGMLKGILQPRHLLAASGSVLHPRSACVDYMFNEISKYCETDFLSIHKAFYYQTFIGIMLESQYTVDATDTIDTDYVRARTGVCEYYFSSLAIPYDCLDFIRHLTFWGSALGMMGHVPERP
jgi:hypothetical protein